jgi:hypothetical protein
MDTLIDQFELKQTGRFRGNVDADDVLGILHHHWTLPEERQRVQLAGHGSDGLYALFFNSNRDAQVHLEH